MENSIERLAFSCADCAKRESCADLCDRAKRYADQDYVSLKEKLLGKSAVYGASGDFAKYAMPGGVILNERQICVHVLLSAGVPRKIVRVGMALDVEELKNIVKKIKYHFKSAAKNALK